MYDCPVTLYEYPSYMETVNQINDAMNVQKEEHILNVIKQNIDIKIDRTELLKALQYDRDQYNKGYRDGYLSGIEKGMQEVTSKINMNALNIELKEISSILEQCSFDGVATVRVTELIRIHHCLLNIREICQGANEDD